MRNILNTLRPQRLIQLRVNSNIFSTHSLLRKQNNLFDSVRRTMFESTTVYALVHMDGVFARDDVLEGGALFARGL